MTVSDVTITERRVFRACEEIVVGPNVTVMGPNGEAIFNAGDRVVFSGEVALFPDSRLEITVGLPLAPE